MYRLAVLTPFAAPSVRGNAITVSRVVRGLRERGLDARVWDGSSTSESAIAGYRGSDRQRAYQASAPGSSSAP